MLRRRKSSEAEAARKHIQDANHELSLRRDEAATGPVSDEEAEAYAAAEELDGRDFKTGAPTPRRPTSLPPELQMTKSERERAEYEQQERIVDRMRDKIKHAGHNARPGALRNLEREEAKLDRMHQALYPVLTTEEYEQGIPFADRLCAAEDCEEPISQREAFEQAGRCARCYFIGTHADEYGHLNPNRRDEIE